MSDMLVKQLRSGLDAVHNATGPTFTLNANPELPVGNIGGDTITSYVNFLLRFPVGTTITSAKLRLVSRADYSAGGADIGVALLDNFVRRLDEPDVSWPAVANHGAKTIAAGAWTDDEPVDLDVADLLTAYLADADYTHRAQAVFKLTRAAAARYAWSYAGKADYAPRLAVVYALPADAELDPYSQVARTLWELLESCPEFVALVAPGNRIKFQRVGQPHGENATPWKDKISDADLPEVRLVCTTLEPHLQNTSTSSKVVTRWQLEFATDSMLLDAQALPLAWAISRAMLYWTESLLALTWRGEKFVQLARPQPASLGRIDRDMSRGIKGWSALWAAEVILWLNTSKL